MMLAENACQELKDIVKIFGWENRKNRHSPNLWQFPTDIPVIHLWLNYTLHMLCIYETKDDIWTRQLFFCPRVICFGKDDLWEHPSSLIYSHNLYLKQIYSCLYVNINLSFCSLHRYMFIKLCVSKVYIIMTPYCGHVRISSIFCRQMTRYPQKLAWLHL